jgi:CheY-like chemotaxis protein
MVITKYCRDFAFEVVEAKNGLEAINEVENLLQKEKVAFDLIFMDCDMPILDGFEASHRINEFYLERKMFQPGIVAITANVVNEEIRMKIKKSGMKELVLKPLSIDKFKEILFRYLNMKTK